LAEFTGERVIPGQVDADLWNEHIARYAFAARRSAGRCVLDAGCGSGYGSALLAESARSVIGVDIAAEAVAYARHQFTAPRLAFVQASCTSLPFPDASFDLVVAFELIEHLADWSGLLMEIRRVLANEGECVISTPNLSYYAESRRRSGPNPFHVHEFDSEEFSTELGKVFPAVSLLVQNHVEGIGFQPVEGAGEPDLALADGRSDAAESHFLLAICTLAPKRPLPGFVYLPRTGNILRERELHIERLESELATKDAWLEQANQGKQDLVEMFRRQTAELEKSNRWAEELDAQLRAAKERIVQLQQELAELQETYEAKLRELEEEVRNRTEWALETERRLGKELEERCDELAECVRLLDRAEATVVERTAWAQRLDAQVRDLEAVLTAARTSRWLRLGRRLGLGPALGQG